MQKSKIEWTDYTVNPVKGLCPVACPYCYARKLYKRFHWDETIRYQEPGFTIAEIQKIKKPSRIFVGSTMELFGPWIPELWIRDTLEIAKGFPQHTFIFLTKRPWELSKYEWPDNCWVGCSVDCAEDEYKHYRSVSPFAALAIMRDVVQAKVKFLSLEPLTSELCVAFKPRWWANQMIDAGINWLIVGQRTPIRKDIPVSWIRDIETIADIARIPLFQKDNLRNIVALRQEFPKVEVK